jgi:transcription antitermination factor NusG
MKIWMAVYTKPRHEKMTYKYLCEKKIKTYLPLIKVKRKWSDRYQWIEKPMFTSYIFVYADKNESLNIVQTYGVHHIIKIGGVIVPIHEYEIEGIRQLIEGGFNPEPTDYFVVGDEVEIIGGPLKSMIGQVSRIKGQDYFMLKIDAIKHAIQCQIERRWLKMMKEKTQRTSV